MRHITPFGMPVVPPVYKNHWSSPDRSIRGIGSCSASSASYSRAPASRGLAVVDLDHRP